MKTRFGLGAVMASLTTALILAGESSGQGNDLDKKVLDIVKQVGELYKNAKSLHTDYSIEGKVEREDKKNTISFQVSCDIERPNRIAVHSHRKGEKQGGLDVVCDGKHLFTHFGPKKEYREAEAPSDLNEMGLGLLQLGQERTGMLFVNVLHSDPYEQLMDGVNSCSYAGMEKVGKHNAHHLKFSQDAFDWEMWVAAKGKPFVLKMTRKIMGNEVSASFVEIYRNWKVDHEIPQNTFTFTPPKGATRVNESKE